MIRVLLIVFALIVGLVAGAGLGLRYYRDVAPRVSFATWLVRPNPAPASAPAPASTPAPAQPSASPSAQVASCTLWSSDGTWNVTIYGDHSSGTFTGYCDTAPKSKFAMHQAGPAAGTVTCDMTDQGERFVFQDTASRTYVPCDRATPFFEAVRAVGTS